MDIIIDSFATNKQNHVDSSLHAWWIFRGLTGQNVVIYISFEANIKASVHLVRVTEGFFAPTSRCYFHGEAL